MQWWRKREMVESNGLSLIDRSLVRVHRIVLKLAAYLQARSHGLSKKTKVILLLLFVTLFCTGSALVLYQSLVAPSARIIAVTKRRVVPLQREVKLSRMTSREYARVQRFKAYIDSLGGTRSGRRLRDSLLQHRPHLMDSVHILLQRYHEQNKIENHE